MRGLLRAASRAGGGSEVRPAATNLAWLWRNCLEAKKNETTSRWRCTPPEATSNSVGRAHKQAGLAGAARLREPQSGSTSRPGVMERRAL